MFYRDPAMSAFMRDEPERLWICTAATCRWACFLTNPTGYDRCMDHDVEFRRPAWEGDRDLDVELPDGRTVTIDSYDPQVHTRASLEAA